MDHPVAEYLRRAGVTQEQFAERIGVRQPVVSKFLSGDIQAFSQEVAEKIVAVTGGRVTLLDCLYSTPFWQRVKAGEIKAKTKKSKNGRPRTS